MCQWQTCSGPFLCSSCNTIKDCVLESSFEHRGASWQTFGKYICTDLEGATSKAVFESGYWRRKRHTGSMFSLCCKRSQFWVFLLSFLSSQHILKFAIEVWWSVGVVWSACTWIKFFFFFSSTLIFFPFFDRFQRGIGWKPKKLRLQILFERGHSPLLFASEQFSLMLNEAETDRGIWKPWEANQNLYGSAIYLIGLNPHLSSFMSRGTLVISVNIGDFSIEKQNVLWNRSGACLTMQLAATAAIAFHIFLLHLECRWLGPVQRSGSSRGCCLVTLDWWTNPTILIFGLSDLGTFVASASRLRSLSRTFGCFTVSPYTPPLCRYDMFV